MAFCDAELSSGIDIVLSACRFAERIAGADLIVTGEGKIDAQTVSGKTISGIARVAAAAGVPVIALAGQVADADALAKEGVVVDRRKIEIEEPIRSLGVFKVKVKLGPELSGEVKVWVVKAD